MKKRTRKIVGYILIIIGIGLPLIGFTGMTMNNLLAKGEYKSFRSTYLDQSKELLSTFEDEIIAYNENIKKQNSTTIVDPFTANGFETEYNIEDISNGGIFAFLVVPKLEMIKPIYLDATYEHLDMGVAHIDGTNLPIGGDSTRSVIAGHRGWYRDTMFLNIDDLVEGDKVYVDRGSEMLVYEVSDKEVIGPSDWDKLAPREGEDVLTLLTCHPFRPPRPYRLLVNCVRILPEEFKEVDLEATSVDKLLESMASEKVDSTNRYMNFGIYAVTAIGWLALIAVIVKFLVVLVDNLS